MAAPQNQQQGMNSQLPPSLAGMPQQLPLFQDASKKFAPDPRMDAMNNDVNDQSRKLRVLEERYIVLRKKTQVTEQNMLANYKRINTQLKTAVSDVSELKHEMAELVEKVVLLQKEIEQCAKKEDVKVIEKYILFWNPTNYITKSQVEKKINELRENH